MLDRWVAVERVGRVEPFGVRGGGDRIGTTHPTTTSLTRLVPPTLPGGFRPEFVRGSFYGEIADARCRVPLDLRLHHPASKRLILRGFVGLAGEPTRIARRGLDLVPLEPGPQMGLVHVERRIGLFSADGPCDRAGDIASAVTPANRPTMGDSSDARGRLVYALCEQSHYRICLMVTTAP